jgi:hypothetical protein
MTRRKRQRGESKTIVNLFIINGAIVFVCFIVYFYLTLVLDWDPRITIIPVIAVLVTAGLYLNGKLKKITAESKNLPE